MNKLNEKQYRLFLGAISHIERQDKYAQSFMLTGKYIGIAKAIENKVKKLQRGETAIAFSDTELDTLRDIHMMEAYICEKENNGEGKENLVTLCAEAFRTLYIMKG